MRGGQPSCRLHLIGRSSSTETYHVAGSHRAVRAIADAGMMVGHGRGPAFSDVVGSTPNPLRSNRELDLVATVSVRYIVNDVEQAIAFYCQQLDFAEVMHPAPTFAMLSRGDLRLTL